MRVAYENTQSKSFHTDGLKEAMKETSKTYTNPLLSYEENKKLNLWNQEVEPFTNNCEDDKEAELYTNKDVLECEVHEESAFDVKEICVTSNNEMVTMKDYYMESSLVSSNDHMNIGDDHDETRSVASSGTQELDADLPVNEPITDHGNMVSKSIDMQISVQDLQNSIPDYKEFGIKEEVINNGPDISLQPGEEQIDSSGIKWSLQDRPLPSLKSLLESFDQQPCESPEEKISTRPVENKTATEGNIPLNLNNTEPATSNGDHNIDNLERVNELSIEPNTVPRLQDAGSVNAPVVNTVHHDGDGDSTLSVAGPISGLVTCSRRIGFSGSTSLRSDSSTTSTRSFAFPILQNEWNTSPVRMAKADRKILQKHHRGWRHGFLCFRF